MSGNLSLNLVETPYLIQFTYDHWCQGYEDATISILVYAVSYDSACVKIHATYENARMFKNLTIK
jgi:hypothetical protein